jgi:hypothetical protein
MWLYVAGSGDNVGARIAKPKYEAGTRPVYMIGAATGTIIGADSGRMPYCVMSRGHHAMSI